MAEPLSLAAAELVQPEQTELAGDLVGAVVLFATEPLARGAAVCLVAVAAREEWLALLDAEGLAAAAAGLVPVLLLALAATVTPGLWSKKWRPSEGY